ncbi:MAG: hypothetical protein H7199_02270 [Burkholderiales bacterium]|nr:hypothetical protein [Flavobacterium sp.]
MRKILIVLAFLFAVIAIAFAILPMGTIGLIPAGLALLFSVLAFVKSSPEQKNIPKWLLVAATLTLIVIIARSFATDTVANDPEFEKTKIESKQEDLKDLEDL